MEQSLCSVQSWCLEAVCVRLQPDQASLSSHLHSLKPHASSIKMLYPAP